MWELETLTKLSLNYNKIDTIENLNALVNLKELDLSFNCIEFIQNLEHLEKLEVLSLFSNRIEKIENLCLPALIILNLGRNRIDSFDGIERLRFLSELKVFNMEQNPINRKDDIKAYVIAYLPNLVYYCYAHISAEDKRSAAKIYS